MKYRILILSLLLGSLFFFSYCDFEVDPINPDDSLNVAEVETVYSGTLTVICTVYNTDSTVCDTLEFAPY